MSSSLVKYVTVFKTSLKNKLQYKADAVFSWIMSIFSVIIPLVLWTAIFKQNDQIAGFTLQSVRTYMLIVTIFSSFIIARDINREICHAIFNGDLNKFIIKPIDFRLFMFFKNIGLRLFECIIKIVPSLVVMLILAFFDIIEFGAFNSRLLLMLISLLPGLLLSYLMYFTMGILGFWFLKPWAIFWIVEQIISFLSGLFFPLDIFQAYMPVFNVFPFKYQIYFPIQLYLYDLSGEDILYGFVMQSVWVIIMLFISNLIWKLGLKKYTAVGG